MTSSWCQIWKKKLFYLDTYPTSRTLLSNVTDMQRDSSSYLLAHNFFFFFKAILNFVNVYFELFMSLQMCIKVNILFYWWMFSFFFFSLWLLNKDFILMSHLSQCNMSASFQASCRHFFYSMQAEDNMIKPCSQVWGYWHLLVLLHIGDVIPHGDWGTKINFTVAAHSQVLFMCL